MIHQRTIGRSVSLFTLSSAIVLHSHAAVVEPNGQEVPILRPADPANYSETTIQDYFNGVGEGAINAVTAAGAEPGKFSPLCNFDVTMVLSQSGAAAGISWYNVDEVNPARVPMADELHELIKPTTVPNAKFSAASIRSDSGYKGGYIGFALTRYDNGTDKPQVPVYYSEYRRNTLCSGCNPEGQWIAALAFHSTLRSDTYYLAFEDWPTYGGATPTDWRNDGDFNDKVFKIVGISCAGGGSECSTGKLGLCGKGIADCARDGQKTSCTQVYEPRSEVCDAIDNDCNGAVDDGGLCPTDQVCLRGSCVFPCGGLEFKCPDGLVCGSDGYCIDSKCRDIVCASGLACRNGTCTSPCSDVVCPSGQTCVDGSCRDLCLGKICGPDSVCQEGACIGTCGCVPCKDGRVCDIQSGICVASGCEGKACALGQTCVGGSCIDACMGARCPGGANCANGTCAPWSPSATDRALNSASGGGVAIPSISVGGNAAVSSGEISMGASAGRFESGTPLLNEPSSGACACEIRKRQRSGSASALAIALLVCMRRRPRGSNSAWPRRRVSDRKWAPGMPIWRKRRRIRLGLAE